jgi:hypothetical protein
MFDIVLIVRPSTSHKQNNEQRGQPYHNHIEPMLNHVHGASIYSNISYCTHMIIHFITPMLNHVHGASSYSNMSYCTHMIIHFIEAMLNHVHGASIYSNISYCTDMIIHFRLIKVVYKLTTRIH